MLAAYRGVQVPQSEAYARLHDWWSTVSTRAAFVATRVDDQRLVGNYSGYANASATSEVARTIGQVPSPAWMNGCPCFAAPKPFMPEFGFYPLAKKVEKADEM